jgi:hypothetical protein
MLPPVDRRELTQDTPAGRLTLVVVAEMLFAVLVDLVTGTPPAFVTTVAFGMALAVGLSWQARRQPV